MAVQGFQRGLQFHRDGQRIELGVLAPPLLRHLFADVLPELAVDGHFRAGDVVGHRHARQFDDAAFDGVHQREVAHRPGKQRTFHVARTGQEERRGRQVDHLLQTQLAVDCLQTGNPQARGFVLVLDVFLGRLEVIAGQGLPLSSMKSSSEAGFSR